mmetsp:Transcript_23664/g.38558  ORF Transcript_23664/g.38558 Transcript_23664/m.38558 type:complete len:128 (+) Transcript_23664:72-455(+)
MMKSFLFVLACVLASASAFAPVSHSKVSSTQVNIVPLKRPDIEYTYDDGLTELERKQRKTIPAFLTGSAKSNPDPSAIDPELVESATFDFPPFLSAIGSIAGTFIFFAFAKASIDPTTYLDNVTNNL